MAVLEAVKTATGLSVDVNAVNGEGDTALHIAVLRDFNSVVQFLVENGARLDIRNKKQQTPLALAITRKASNAIDVLQKAGAKQ